MLLIGIIIFSAVQSAAVKFYNRTDSDAFVFNFVKSLAACAVLAVLSAADFHINALTAAYGGIYGLSLGISMYSGYKALAMGPMSLTSLIVSFSVVIPIFYGVFFSGEPLSNLKIVGLVFLAAALLTANMKKPEMSRKGSSYAWWIFYVAMTFMSNGLCSVLQKMHQQRYPGEYCAEFTLISMLICGVIFLALTLVHRSGKVSTRGKKYSAVSGAAMAAVSFMTIKLSGAENASVLFPAISAGTICASLLCGTIIFREKLRCNHIIALVCGIAAVICLKL